MFPSEEDAQCYLVSHYNLGSEYYNKEQWKKASDHFERVIYFFPESEEAADATYFLGVCYYSMKEYDFANEAFSTYLKGSKHPPYFEDALYYKYTIAEFFRCGKKRRPGQFRYLPKWCSGQEMALTIYDEIVAAFPCHELTVLALNSKAELLQSMRLYRESIDTYQFLIRRFPKDEVTPECYLNITKVYWTQSKIEFQNPDILGLAELNIEKFKSDFPRDERIQEAEMILAGIRDNFARGFCRLGGFYERTKNPEAAIIYYKSAIEQYPETPAAEFSRGRLLCLEAKEIPIEEEVVCRDENEEEEQPAVQEFSAEVIAEEVPSAEEQVPAETLTYEEPQDYSNEVALNEYVEPQNQEIDYSYSYPSIIEIPQELAEEAMSQGIPCVIDQSEPEEDSATFIHYSLSKKRDMKYVSPAPY